jgi:hypothetical protein
MRTYTDHSREVIYKMVQDMFVLRLSAMNDQKQSPYATNLAAVVRSGMLSDTDLAFIGYELLIELSERIRGKEMTAGQVHELETSKRAILAHIRQTRASIAKGEKYV